MLTFPNALTVLRLALVPLIAYLLVRGAFQPAFACFILAGVTDFADGLLARHFNQRSEFGAWLDPAADKALIVIIFTLLTGLGHVPHWLLIAVALRDILIVTAVADLYLTGRPPLIRPLMISKLTTFMQILYLALVLFHLAFTTAFDKFIDGAAIATAALTGLSFLAYFKVWLGYRRGSARSGSGTS